MKKKLFLGTILTFIASFLVVFKVSAEGTTNLTINNIQTDNTTGSYTYNITIENVSGAIKYSVDGKEGYAVFDAKGSAKLTVNSNSTITLYDIPLNKNYTIEQTSKLSGYKTIVNNVETSISTGVTSPTNNVSFTNKSVDDSKETTTTEKNPVTADPIMIIASIAVVGIISFVALRMVKVRRYE